MISIVVECNRNKIAMHWNKLLMLSIVVQCITIALLMISTVDQCNRNKLAMHWNCIAYDKHRCSMQ